MAIYLPIVTSFNDKGLKTATKGFKDLETTSQKAQFALKKAAVPATLALGALAAVAKLATKEASDLGESINAVAVVFGDSSKEILKLSDAASKSVGLSKKDFNSLAVQFSSFATKIAGKGGKVSSVIEKLTKRSADFASVMNIDVADAAAKFQSGLAGEAEPLKKFGIDISQAAIETFAYANGIAEAGEKLTENQKVLARYGTIMEQTDKTANDFANTSGSLANQQRILDAQMTDFKATLGEALLPVIQKVTAVALKFSQWAQENTTTFQVIAGVIGGLSLAIFGVNAAMTIWKATTKAFAAVQVAFNAVMAANPIVLITLGIAALVVGLVIAYKKFETFRNIVNSVGQAIKTGFLVYFTIIKTEAQILYEVFKLVFNGIASAWNNTVGKISFTLPKWIPGGLGGQGFSVPKIPMLANGGIVDKPGGMLALIGERGPEAVIPLTGPNAGGLGMNITVNAGLVSTPDQIGQDIIAAIQKAQRRSGQVFASA